MARNLAKLLLVGVLLASGVLLPGCAGETQAPLEPRGKPSPLTSCLNSRATRSLK